MKTDPTGNLSDPLVTYLLNTVTSWRGQNQNASELQEKLAIKRTCF